MTQWANTTERLIYQTSDTPSGLPLPESYLLPDHPHVLQYALAAAAAAIVHHLFGLQSTLYSTRTDMTVLEPREWSSTYCTYLPGAPHREVTNGRRRLKLPVRKRITASNCVTSARSKLCLPA